MTVSLQGLRELAARARRENPPEVEVSRQVLLRLGGEIPAPAWPMKLVALGGAVTALIVLAISLPFMEMLIHPMSAFFWTAVAVLP